MCSQNSVGLYTALGFQSVTCYTYETLQNRGRVRAVLGGPLLSPNFSFLLPPAFSSLSLETNLTQLFDQIRMMDIKIYCEWASVPEVEYLKKELVNLKRKISPLSK